MVFIPDRYNILIGRDMNVVIQNGCDHVLIRNEIESMFSLFSVNRGKYIKIIYGRKNMKDEDPVLKKMRGVAPAGDGEHGFFKNQDGYDLFFRLWSAKNPAKIVICLHGAFAHGEFFSIVADRLVPRGITTAVFDYQGHGRSGGRRGDVKNMADWHRDAADFIEFIRSKVNADLPVFLLGESMGGQMAAGISVLYPDLPVSGFILFSPAVQFKSGKFSEMLIKAIPNIFNLLFAPGKPVIDITGNPADGITDPLHQEYDARDPLRFDKASPRYLLELNKSSKIALSKGPQATKKPVIIMAGSNDTSVEVEGIKDYFRRLDAGRDKKLIIADGAKHSILDDPAFIPYWRDIYEWLDKH
jgi:alpha-beta hydrolase superfamily lysophospholipase